MASAKETPRQKLIGIMYLILLALLALQVSSAIMEKFKYLDDSISLSNTKMNINSDKLDQSIAKGVKDLGNKPSDMALQEQGRRIREEAAKVRVYLEGLRQQIIKETGGYEDPNDPNSMFVGAKDEGKIEDLMIGAKKAIELQHNINGYCGKLREITGNSEYYTDIALDPVKDSRISKSSEQKNKSFAEFNFAATPMVAAMAVLSNMQAEVNKYELHALEIIQNKVGGYRMDFDRVIPMYRANANTVVAGTKYKAEVFLTATSSSITPVITANGKSLSVDNNGIGNLEFLASSEQYDQFGFANKKWSGKVTFKNKGKDTSFTIEGEYRVAKPYVDVQSSVPPSLYRNCANQLKFSCPPLGAEFSPNFNGSSGGEIITSNSPGKVVLVPKDPEMKIKIANNGAAIDQKTFRVQLVPRPTVKLYNGDREVNIKEGLKLPLPVNLKLVIIPDPLFKSVCPEDAKYNPTETEVTVIRRRTSKLKFIAKNGLISMADIRKLDLMDGDRIYIEPIKVQRANFRNQLEDVKVSEIFNISLYTN